MSNMHPLDKLIDLFSASLENDSFVRMSLGHYSGNDEGLKNIHIRLILVKREVKLSFTFRYMTRDIVKNMSVNEGVLCVRNYLTEDFRLANLFTLKEDLTLLRRKDSYKLSSAAPSLQEKPSLSHNKEKKRLIEARQGASYLHDLRITDAEGNVYKNAQDKYKQINHFISLLKPLIEELPMQEVKRVVDMGSGKGYLTFALYDYLHNVLKQEGLEMCGVEFRKDLVDVCNQIAVKAKFDNLRFVQGSIIDYPTQEFDALIALHACDTATDDAIYKGVHAGAKLIVVAPCCHKQIRRQMEKSKRDSSVEVLTRFGIFLERQAEMLTDGLRALILEYFGYKTKVFEFISDVHTPKNVLIAGVKLSQEPSAQRKKEILNQIQQTKDYFGVAKHYLEELFVF